MSLRGAVFILWLSAGRAVARGAGCACDAPGSHLHVGVGMEAWDASPVSPGLPPDLSCPHPRIVFLWGVKELRVGCDFSLACLFSLAVALGV